MIERLDYLEALRTAEHWAELHSLVMVRAERRLGEQASIERRYYTPHLRAVQVLAASRCPPSAGWDNDYLLTVLAAS